MAQLSFHRPISRDDLLPLAEYARQRDERRRSMTQFKQNRRVHVGPDITFYFENFATMLHQVHEMLYIERGGEEQIDDELRAYNPLIPNGRELIATMMIEIDDPVRRNHVLRRLAAIEQAIHLDVAGETVRAQPADTEERTTPDGKTSSVHFLRFPFSAEQIASFRTPGTRVVLAITHPEYDHMAALSEPVRAALAADFA